MFTRSFGPTAWLLVSGLCLMGCPSDSDDTEKTSETGSASSGTSSGGNTKGSSGSTDSGSGSTKGSSGSTATTGASGDTGTSDGTNDTGDTSGTDGGSKAMPADDKEATLTAFLAAKSYTGEGWTAETDKPRKKSSTSSPHEDVRVYLNDTLVASQAAGNGEDLDKGPAHDKNSMVVKELYEGTELVGVAAMFKTADGLDPTAWTYYCYGPAERCATGEPETTPTDPIYGQGVEVSCGFCHGGLVNTKLP